MPDDSLLKINSCSSIMGEIKIKVFNFCNNLCHFFRTTFIQESREIRQQHFMDRYGFQCSCEACERNFNCLSLREIINLRIYRPEFLSIEESKNKFKENCEILMQHQKYDYEMLKITFENMYLLAIIAKAEPFIFEYRE